MHVEGLMVHEACCPARTDTTLRSSRMHYFEVSDVRYMMHGESSMVDHAWCVSKSRITHIMIDAIKHGYASYFEVGCMIHDGLCMASGVWCL